jgi:hypothetical protein
MASPPHSKLEPVSPSPGKFPSKLTTQEKTLKINPPPMHQSHLCNYYIALGDAILSSSALHCSGKCIAHSHPSREIRNLQHSLRNLVLLVRVFCAWDVRVSHFACIWRESKGSTSGYQYRYSVHFDRTGGYKFTSISRFFFLVFLAQMKNYIGKRILFLLSKSVYEGRYVIG